MPAPEIDPDLQLGLAIGMLTIRWSMVEGGWHSIFVWLYAIESGRKSVSLPRVNALYNSHRSFAGQRQMVIDYASAILSGEKSALVADLRRLHKVTNDLAGMRNAVQHAQFMRAGPSRETTKLQISPLNPSKKLDDKDVHFEITELIPKVESLAAELGLWTLRLMGHEPKPPNAS